MAINDPQFRHLKSIGSDMYEIQSAYKKIRLDVPVHIGVNILFEAKLRMLEYHYDFLSYFLLPESFSHIIMDTDSLYSCYVSDSLSDSVRDDRKEEFRNMLEASCSQQGKSRHPKCMLTRICCSECSFTDSKTPYLFKVEYSAEYVLALTSKTYVCEGSADASASIKLSCKGAQKSLVLQSQPVAMFENVLQTGLSRGTTNRGFISKNGQTFTYEVVKTAFPYFYVKRDVLPIEGHTRTLPITLHPVPKNFIILQTDAQMLAPDAIKQFKYSNFTVHTIRQAHCFAKYLYCCNALLEGFPNIELCGRILNSVDAGNLDKMHEAMGECETFIRDEYNILYDIVESRMNEHPSLYSDLDTDSSLYIVNACPHSRVTGNGENHRVTRYRPDAYLQGLNYLGRIYMSIRDDVRQFLLTQN